MRMRMRKKEIETERERNGQTEVKDVLTLHARQSEIQDCDLRNIYESSIAKTILQHDK